MHWEKAVSCCVGGSWQKSPAQPRISYGDGHQTQGPVFVQQALQLNLSPKLVYWFATRKLPALGSWWGQGGIVVSGREERANCKNHSLAGASEGIPASLVAAIMSF